MKRFIFALACLFALSCTKETSIPFVSMTGATTHISCRNAEISGKANLPSTTTTDLSFGVLYSTSSGVLFGTATQIQAQSFDSECNFTVNTEVLEPETTYYYRSYIIQDKEIAYGELRSFKTLAINSMIKTEDVTDINLKDAVFNAYLDLTDCKYDGIEYGFEVTPDGGQTYTLKSNNHSEKKFSVNNGTLSIGTRYSVVAYVKLDGHTYKGEAKTFTTKFIEASVTAESSNVSYYTATISGKLTVTSEGTFTKSVALYYSTTANTLESLKSSGTKKTLTLGSDGSYSIDLSSLVSDTQYYYTVVSKVDEVELNTDVKSFTTLKIQASVTAESTNISYHTATISGKLAVTSEGTFTKSATLYYSSTASTLEALKARGTKKNLTLSTDGSFNTDISSLIPNTKFYFAVVSKVDDKEFDTSVNNFTTKAFAQPQTVDLGLSVKWASFNIGATKPEEYGRYFAWGDVVGQTWNGSSWSGGGFSTYPTYDIYFNKNLKPKYDAAHVNLGGSWRMPTKAELQELIDNCTCTWTSNYNGTGVAGVIFISKKSGYTDKSIFLPVAGYGYKGDLCLAGTYGNYWSSTFYNFDYYAWDLDFYSDDVSMDNDSRSDGHPVRPVSE